MLREKKSLRFRKGSFRKKINSSLLEIRDREIGRQKLKSSLARPTPNPNPNQPHPSSVQRLATR